MTRFISRVIPVVAVFALLVLAGSAAAAEKASGKIKNVTVDKKEFVLTDKEGKDWTFQMPDAGKIRLNDKEAELKELKAGDEVEITYVKVGALLTATEVNGKRK